MYRIAIAALVSTVLAASVASAQTMSDEEILWTATIAISLGRDHCGFDQEVANGKVKEAIRRLSVMLGRSPEDIGDDLKRRVTSAFEQMGEPTEDKVKQLCANVYHLSGMPW